MIKLVSERLAETLLRDQFHPGTHLLKDDRRDHRESTVEELEILDHELVDNDFGASVTGVVENGTGRELEYVEVGVVVYNEEGQRTEDWFDNTTNLPDGEQWVFEVLLESSAHEVSDYTIAVTDSPF